MNTTTIKTLAVIAFQDNIQNLSFAENFLYFESRIDTIKSWT
ncbi:hypothetical protein N9545_04390 [Salibacteraceae bacterium]|nr:hypothetical protein [Salibacteraceae bacterium]